MRPGLQSRLTWLKLSPGGSRSDWSMVKNGFAIICAKSWHFLKVLLLNLGRSTSSWDDGVSNNKGYLQQSFFSNHHFPILLHWPTSWFFFTSSKLSLSLQFSLSLFLLLYWCSGYWLFLSNFSQGAFLYWYTTVFILFLGLILSLSE